MSGAQGTKAILDKSKNLRAIHQIVEALAIRNQACRDHHFLIRLIPPARLARMNRFRFGAIVESDSETTRRLQPTTDRAAAPLHWCDAGSKIGRPLIPSMRLRTYYR